MLLNLIGEAGELVSKIAKSIRKEGCVIDDNRLWLKLPLEDGVKMDEELRKETGDILWQLAGFCSVMGWKLEDIARVNLEKLASRKERGVIVGDGDNR